MSQDEFTKLSKYLQDEFEKVNDRLEQTVTKVELNQLIDTVDAYAKRVDDYTQEMLMLAHKVDRLEKWINQIAAKTGVKLDY